MAANPIYSGFFDLLVTKSSPKEILDYNVPDGHQAYIESLIAKGKVEDLTDRESQEISDFLDLTHLILLVKSRAAVQLKSGA